MKIKLENKFKNAHGDIIREISVSRKGEKDVNVMMENSNIIYTSKILTGTESSKVTNRYTRGR